MEGKRAENREFRPHARLMERPFTPYNLQPRINHMSVPQGVPVERPRARGTRERKGDDKSD